MQEKAEQGIWPTKAPLGYLNVLGAGRVRAALVGPPRHANRNTPRERYLDEIGIPKTLVRGLVVFVLALAAAYGVAFVVERAAGLAG